MSEVVCGQQSVLEGLGSWDGHYGTCFPGDFPLPSAGSSCRTAPSASQSILKKLLKTWDEEGMILTQEVSLKMQEGTA